MELNINGMHIHVIKTKKFKTFLLSFKMVNNLEKETAFKRFMISDLLATSTKKYPNETALSRKSDYLYGCDIHTDVSTKGNLHIIEISFEAINTSFVNDPHYFEEMIDLLNEMIFHPDIDENGFNQDSFERCLDNYEQFFDALYDRRDGYGTNHLCELMAPDHPLGYLSYGTVDQLDLLDPLDLACYYQSILKNDRKDLYLVGDISDEMIEIIKEKIHFEENENDYSIVNCFNANREKMQYIVEKQDVTQTLINIGLTTSTTYFDKDSLAMSLANSIFGANSNSLLFQLIREQNSLCYYIDSSYDPYYGIIFISAAIDGKNTKQVISLIEKCLERLKCGDFSDELIDRIKKMSLETSKSLADSLQGIVGNRFRKDLCHLPPDYSNVKEFKALTKEQVVEVSQKLKIDTIFILGDEK